MLNLILLQLLKMNCAQYSIKLSLNPLRKKQQDEKKDGLKIE